MIDLRYLYDDREDTVRRIDRLEEEKRICQEHIDNWIAQMEEINAELDKEIEFRNTIDSNAVKLYGPNMARKEGFYVP
jgi:hypothetical protein